jgi:hypothetical protein
MHYYFIIRQSKWFHQNMHAISLSEIHLSNLIQMDALDQETRATLVKGSDVNALCLGYPWFQ